MLPVGSTALDFAFTIHSAIGGKCIGAKVNHKLVPISHKLRSGDQVEIIPNHSCLTEAHFDEYVVLEGDRVMDRWHIERGR